MRKKNTSKGIVQCCRFGFPRSITNQFTIRDVATSIAGRKNLKSKSRLYDIPRLEEEANINDYNPAILKRGKEIWTFNSLVKSHVPLVLT